jgi:hypothetical protein
MTLTDIVVDATAAFVGGFALGASGKCDVALERLEEAEAYLGDELLRKEGIGKDEKERARKMSRDLSLCMPAFVSMIYSAGADILRLGQGGFMENIVVAAPAAYVGHFTGRGLRRFVRANKLHDLKVIGRIKNNPDNVLEVLPERQAKVIQGALDEVEGMVRGGEDIKKRLVLPGSPTYRMHRAIIDDAKPYTSDLIAWSLEQLREAVERAHIQREIMKVYEDRPPASFSVLGSPDKPKIRVYEVDGERLNVYTAEATSLRKIKDDKTGISYTEGDVPVVERESSVKWEKDYRSLAEQIRQNQKDCTTMLINTVPGMPDLARRLFIIDTYAKAKRAYSEKKD